MVCFRYIIVNTVYKGDDDDNSNLLSLQYTLSQTCLLTPGSLQRHPRIQPPPIYVRAAFRGTWRMLNFTQVGIVLNSIDFFYFSAEKITKSCFEMYNKKYYVNCQ